jgi:uncharacterized protein (DUF1800 family)
MHRKLGWRRICGLLATAWLLLGCDGSDNDAPTTTAPPTVATMPTRDEASRFLMQASFGASDAEIDRVVAIGYPAWIEDQFSLGTRVHRTYLDGRSAALAPQGFRISQDDFIESFWNSAVSGPDQLRQRMTFALSQIFVISLLDSGVSEQVRGVGAYYDMLGANAFGNFRTLLRDVALHPMMGLYLSHLRNQKESPGRVPDENFAREVMQLFSIGLYELNVDGSVKHDSAGKPIETYGPSDVGGMARVFTGWSWHAGSGASARTAEHFFGTVAHPDRDWQPMQAYTQAGADFHSVGEKRFLGQVIAASGSPDPEGDLSVALDALFNHPNVGPFIGRLLIQRLVTSNPSNAYIARVAAAFNDNGQGMRGDLKAVVRAILLDSEARQMTATDIRSGKLREPILRFAHFLRAFRSTSGSGRWVGIDRTDDPSTSLGQTAMRSPSVFNFFRPDYAPNRSELAAASVVAPEFQIVNEVSVAGFLNYLQSWLARRMQGDVRQDYTPETVLAREPERLVAHLDTLLTGGRMSATLRQRLVAAIRGRDVPAALPDSQGAVLNASAIDMALRDRVCIAILLTMASPDYLVQR